MSDLILLDVDGVLLFDPIPSFWLDSADRLYDSISAEDEPHADRSCNVVETITVTDMAGDHSDVEYRPSVIEALRAAHDAGTRIGWLTSWLTVPDRLEQLADQLGGSDESGHRRALRRRIRPCQQVESPRCRRTGANQHVPVRPTSSTCR